jgi:hypothetical protein
LGSAGCITGPPGTIAPAWALAAGPGVVAEPGVGEIAVGDDGANPARLIKQKAARMARRDAHPISWSSNIADCG